jgi:hypothetical protein
MTLKRMLERAAAARETFEDRLDRLNEHGPAAPPAVGGDVTAEGTLATILAADCARALGDLAGLETPPAKTVIEASALPAKPGNVAGNAGASP